MCVYIYVCGSLIENLLYTAITPLSLSLIPSLDSYDVIFTAGADVILSKFKDFKSRVVFSAEGFCWPDKSLAVSPLNNTYIHTCTCTSYKYIIYSIFLEQVPSCWTWETVLEFRRYIHTYPYHSCCLQM